ncbi:cupin domain-containing protein [Brevibacillus parabrevis]|uniref:cupin domain-containing protein n=1 Tax=Brevibacillus parabrevis TaxID=54914 RepID=UPI0028D638A2|nr:cupin domain-containing protein [Brevibacillus parabrevis]MED1725218.1 cupin domain-containing protein [Brevibacillus parabrevis]
MESKNKGEKSVAERANDTLKVGKHNAEHYMWGDKCDGWHLVKGQDLSVIFERMPANTAEVRHYHERSRQFFFVLCGQAVLEVEGVRHEIGVQEGVEVPPGAKHQMKNESNADVEFLVISQPTTRGDRIHAE